MRQFAKPRKAKDPAKMNWGELYNHYRRQVATWMFRYYDLERKYKKLQNETAPQRKRMEKEAALKWLSMVGDVVTIKMPTATITEDNGHVINLVEEFEGVYHTSPELLGWTWEELNDPEITE